MFRSGEMDYNTSYTFISLACSFRMYVEDMIDCTGANADPTQMHISSVDVSTLNLRGYGTYHKIQKAFPTLSQVIAECSECSLL